jgi:hypothetical protein
MNVVLSAAALLKQQQKDAGTVVKQQPSINFYRESPNFELTLDEFEVYALKRLKVWHISSSYFV